MAAGREHWQTTLPIILGKTEIFASSQVCVTIVWVLLQVDQCLFDGGKILFPLYNTTPSRGDFFF